METLNQIRRAQRLVAYTGLAEKLFRPHPAAGDAKGLNATVLGEIANLLKSRGIGELDENVCLKLKFKFPFRNQRNIDRTFV